LNSNFSSFQHLALGGAVLEPFPEVHQGGTEAVVELALLKDVVWHVVAEALHEVRGQVLDRPVGGRSVLGVLERPDVALVPTSGRGVLGPAVL